MIGKLNEFNGKVLASIKIDNENEEMTISFADGCFIKFTIAVYSPDCETEFEVSELKHEGFHCKT